MRINYPPNTRLIRDLKPTFSYFLVVKEDSIATDIPLIEYFVYKFLVPVSATDGIKQLRNYFSKIKSIKIDQCREISYNEYATGDFLHPYYKNSLRSPLRIKMRDLPIYIQNKINVIDLNKDKYQYGSKPMAVSRNNYNAPIYPSPILDDNFQSGVQGRKIID